MEGRTFMLLAGEASGDTLGAELVKALQRSSALGAQPAPPAFFGAGGPLMAAAGVDLDYDLTKYAVVGLVEVIKHYRQFRGIFRRLMQRARARQPEFIILIDYPGFNLRFARAIKRHVESRRGTFNNWDPRIVYYVSPQLWAWHESRVHQMARDIDLVLSIFPFEPAWYATRAPGLKVEYVGHPLVDRFVPSLRLAGTRPSSSPPTVLLLPGSRERELKEHLPVLVDAARQMTLRKPLKLVMVVPDETLASAARPFTASLSGLRCQVGQLAQALLEADVALAASGTVTMECAYFRVPTVVIYKTSWCTYQFARRLVKVKYLAMPNLLADEVVYPEFIQDKARPENLVREALDLLDNAERRAAVQTKLGRIIASLGPAGASARAARAILRLGNLSCDGTQEIPCCQGGGMHDNR